MKLSLIILSTFLLFTTGCTTGQSLDEANYVSVLPELVEVENKTDDSITIKMVNTCGSACWDNLKEVINRSESVITIQTMAELTSEICTEQCVRYEREYTVDIPAPGDYTLQFVHRDSVYQSLSITVP